MIAVMTKASLALSSLLVILTIMQTHLPLILPVAPPINLAINLTLVNAETPGCHGFITNVIKWTECKIHNPATSLKCPRILMSCTNPHNLQNIVQLLLLPHVVPTCHHAAIMTLTPLIMLTIITAPQNTAACAVALAVVLAAVIVMMMINIVIDPLVLASTIITLLTQVCKAAHLKIQHCILIDLIIWNSIPTHPPTLTTPFILMAMANVKTLSLPLIALHHIQMMNLRSHHTLGENSPQMRLLVLMSATIMTPKTKEYSYWYHTKLEAQPPAGLVDHHVAKFYHLELKFLDDKSKKQSFAERTLTVMNFCAA